MIIPYDRKVVAMAEEELFSFIQGSKLQHYVSYMIDRNYRKSVKLKRWIKEQVDEPSQFLLNTVDEISDSPDHDTQMKYVFDWVKSKIKYVTDTKQFGNVEYWQEASKTAGGRQGDCEDGAILMYVLARLKKVPANRMLLMCGSVTGGGHCWLAFKPYCYPLNFVFMDWCYWPSKASVAYRKKYAIVDKTIYNGGNYKSLWFAFNEEFACKGLKKR